MSDDGSYMGFVGVTTGGSKIMTVFPVWAQTLGLPTDRLIGHDLAPGSPPEAYRALVRQIRDDPHHRGALVTTHKVGLYRAAQDLFDSLDPLASTFGEVSAIAKQPSDDTGGSPLLHGAAKDPITVGLALADFLSDDHFARTGGQVLCLGSGGAGMALSHQLGVRDDRPSLIICTARTQDELDHLAELHRRAELDQNQFRYALTASTEQADALLAELPSASLVVNATGMGKDVSGSPLGDAAVFPEQSVVWEFNYRGSLEFFHQAQAQADDRALTVVDGWAYFVHGWSQVIAEVFDIAMPPETVAELARVAEALR